MKYLIALVIALASVQANAKTMQIGGGIMCDSIEEVVRLIKEPASPPTGCGVLNGSALAKVTHLSSVRIGDFVFRIARYDFMGDYSFKETQYGYWGKPMKAGRET